MLTTLIPKVLTRGTQYERHASIILEKYGFVWHQEAGFPGDGGIDLRGYFSYGGIKLFNVIGQCKCAGVRSITPELIREFIGANRCHSSLNFDHDSLLLSLFITNVQLTKKALETLNYAPIPMAVGCISYKVIEDAQNYAKWEGELTYFYINLNFQRHFPGFQVLQSNSVTGIRRPMLFFANDNFPMGLDNLIKMTSEAKEAQ